jgi:hypothetical protein
MTFALTIGGTPKKLQAGSLSIRKVANGRSTASFQLDSNNRSYRPPIDAAVTMSVNGVPLVGGLIDRPAEAGLLRGSRPGIRTTVNVVDFTAYTEWRYVNETFPAQTLKQRLLAIVTNYLGDYGVTLHGSQVNGPTLPSMGYEDVLVFEVLNDTVKLTADSGQPFVWKLSDTKVLRGFQPSTQLAPFNLVGDNLTPYVIGDVEVEPSNDGKANKVVVKVAPKSQDGRTESFLYGTDPYPFVLQYTPTKLYGHILLGISPIGSGGGELLGPVGTVPTQWEYDAITNSMTRTAGAPTVGETYTLYFDGVFNGRWEATDPSWTSTPASRRQKVLTIESIPDGTTGQALADNELAKSLTGPIFVKYTTWQNGLEPGQQQTINIPARNVNADGVITEVVIRDQFDHLEYSVTVVVDDAQTNLDRMWENVYRIWAGDKSGGSGVTTVGAGGVSSGGPAAPFQSVQFNNTGAFGGDEAFTFNKEGKTLVGGELSSITAIAAEAGIVFGYDCHVADI